MNRAQPDVDLFRTVEEVIKHTKLLGWLAQFKLRWEPFPIGMNRGAWSGGVGVYVKYTVPDAITGHPLDLMKDYSIIARNMERGAMVVFAGDRPNAEGTAHGDDNLRYVLFGMCPKRAIADALRATVMSFLEHELGEAMVVSDRLPWYPTWDHPDYTQRHKAAGWGEVWHPIIPQTTKW